MSWRFLFVAVAACSASLAQSIALSNDSLTAFDSAHNITWLADFNLPASNRFTLPVCTGSSNGQICVNASGSMDYQSAAAWVAAMNAANYLGHSNWQIPSTPALGARSLGDMETHSGSAESLWFAHHMAFLALIFEVLQRCTPASLDPIPYSVRMTEANRAQSWSRCALRQPARAPQ